MKTNPALKTLAFFLCAVSAAAALWAGIFTLMYWDDIWTEANFFRSSSYRTTAYEMESRVRELLELHLGSEAGLTYTQQERLSALRSALDPAKTNYRYELRLDSTGELLMSNLGDSLLDNVAQGIEMGVFTLSAVDGSHDGDKIYWQYSDESTDNAPIYEGEGEYEERYDAANYEYDGARSRTHILAVSMGSYYLLFDASEQPYDYNEYGWFNNGGIWTQYNPQYDTRIARTTYALRAGVLTGLPVEDDFYTGMVSYRQWHQKLPLVGIAALVSLVLSFVTLAYLLRAAGHREGEEGISLGWQDRIPLDVYAVAVFFLAVFGYALCETIAYGLRSDIRAYRVFGLLAVTTVVAAVALNFLLSAVARAKARQLWQGFLCWHICVWCWKTFVRALRAIVRAVRDMSRVLSMNVRLGLAFLVYLAMNAFLAAGLFRSYNEGFFFIGLVLFNGGVFWLGCRWIDQWRFIRENTRRIVGGDSGIQMDTHKMYGDLKEHAEQLNDLGTAIDHAVDERLKSEHFKAELITNVSHDLKTPLTSIINYVDLLKKTNITDPKALEYLEVLDRKSQRLKKLTEDLVEASKASTGNVTVNAAQMDLVEFTQQAAAEYQDRLTQRRLTLITKMSDHPVYISADGRHMWRILDNLLGNCVKYAMEGTRVYLDVVEWDGKGCISVKNISREALNADPQELTERFVRGDESRTTDGSGLGLSIARSLAEVQGGVFRISTDGDLFKATVYFPVILALEEGKAGEKP